MSRAVLGVSVLAIAFLGTIVYAVTVTAPAPGGTIHACYDKGGKGAGRVRIVNAGAECRKGENPVQWRAMASLNELSDTTCQVNDKTGTTTLEWDPDGYARFKCEVAALCGDLVIDPGEDCDDGNEISGDGCSATCSNEEPECANGDTRSCYSGPSGTDGVGACTAGTQTCSGGTWGTCQGEVTPSNEVCDGADNDCDGTPDDDCSNDVDECALETDNCSAQATCSNTEDGFNCTCNAGYQGDGTTCTDIDECEQQTHDCAAGETCDNTPGSYTCEP